jgi:PAS domain S-box-containing protein
MPPNIEDRRRPEGTIDARWWLSPPPGEELFFSSLDDLPALVALMTPEGTLAYANRHVATYFGATLEGPNGWTSATAFHPNDRPHVLTAWRRSVDTGEPYEVEGRLRGAKGIYRWFRIHGFPLRDKERRIVLWYVLLIDVEDRKRAEALLASEKQLLEMVARGHSASDILDALCHLVESTAGDCYCSVVLVDPSGMRLEHGAAPSLPGSFIDSIIGRAVSLDSGPCAQAAYLNEQVIAADLTSEPRWADDWCPMALAHGLHACWSTPRWSWRGCSASRSGASSASARSR